MPGRRPAGAGSRPTFVLRRRAERDLEEIADYTLENWGEAKLIEYVTALDRAFGALAADRTLGQSADDVREGYFRLRVGSHMIYFRRRRTRVEVVRVLHVRMSPRRHL
jgi:toxin ParE1/3/4